MPYNCNQYNIAGYLLTLPLKAWFPNALVSLVFTWPHARVGYIEHILCARHCIRALYVFSPTSQQPDEVGTSVVRFAIEESNGASHSS